MKNDDVLELIRQCDLKEGEVLIPGKAYLFNKRFSHNQPGEKEEIIVLTKNEIKVGGIYRMGSYDIHVVMEKRYEGQHIMSNFLKTGVLNEIWPENKSVELCDVYTRAEYERKKYLAGLCHMSIKNKAEIERRLDYFDRQRDIHRDHI